MAAKVVAASTMLILRTMIFAESLEDDLLSEDL